MEQKTLSSISLTKAAQSNMPNRILEKINACLSEDESYAADELVGLAEEILNHIAAVGISNYLQSEQQKEVYNDFLIQLFTASSHDYNAGPLYRWAANMIADCSKLTTSNKFAFFWETLAGKVVLCQKINQLAELRNRVMHGFFVLPPEENKKQADAIGDLLLALQVSGFFLQEADFHFIQAGNFTGHWNILEDNHWQKLINDTPFGKLAQRIVIERSEVFWQQEALSTFSVKSNAVNLPDKFESFFNANTRGAYACWVHPADATKGNFYLAMAQWLLNQQNTITVAYTLHETGISFTDGFLLNRLAQVLNTANKVLSGNKKIEDHVKSLRKDYKGKVVVLVNQVHIALFSQQHLTRLNNFLFDNEILLFSVGYHYEHFNAIFNSNDKLEFPSAIPTADQMVSILHNYLRFKGPHADKRENSEAVKKLKDILNHLCDELLKGEELYARRFADDYNYEMEYVHEIFALLHPWVKSSRKIFEEDTIDELYGFPNTITETTPIYLALGRRDLKLEYQHKVLSL